MFIIKGDIINYQKTIKTNINFVGIGLHKGIPINIELSPLPIDSGIIFYRKDTDTYIPLKPENVVNTQMATVIGKNGTSISTIEHLLSAVYSFGIDNLLISVDDNEIPIMDGSSASFCLILNEVGIVEQTEKKKYLKILKEVSVTDGQKFVKVSPNKETIFNFEIDFKKTIIGNQNFNFKFTKENYINEISRARTFGFLHEVQYLRSKELALGANFDNAIVVGDSKVLNIDGLRFNDEFVRHKILDAIGDMSLLGHLFIGKYESFAGSHHLNHLLTKKILEDSSNYQII